MDLKYSTAVYFSFLEHKVTLSSPVLWVVYRNTPNSLS